MQKILYSFLLFLFFPTSFISGQKKINTVTIGKQIWMSENLNAERFQNGDKILHAQSDEEWINAGKNKVPAWCIDDVPSGNGENDRLYNWYAVSDKRNICPTGYHVATDSDWQNLATTLGGEAIAGSRMKAKSGWQQGGNGTNESGFAAKPGAVRIKDAVFSPKKSAAAWWSGTQYDEQYAVYRSIYFSSNQLSSNTFNKSYGCYVRCVKD